MRNEVVLEESLGKALFLETIQKSPVGTLAQNATLDFCADGVRLPINDEVSKDEYIKVCIKRQIIPFSWIKLEYGWDGTLKNSGVLVPETSLFNPDIPSPLSGGKIHRVRVDLPAHERRLSDITQWFITNYLTALGSNGYTLNYGEVFLDHNGHLFFTLRNAQAIIGLEMEGDIRTHWNQWFGELMEKPEVQPELSVF